MTALTGMSRQKSSEKFFRKIKIPAGDKISIVKVHVLIYNCLLYTSFQDADLITLRVKRQERSLFLICKVVKP